MLLVLRCSGDGREAVWLVLRVANSGAQAPFAGVAPATRPYLISSSHADLIRPARRHTALSAGLRLSSPCSAFLCVNTYPPIEEFT